LTAGFKLGASAVALLAVVGASGAAFAQSEDLETVVVTGFRASLEKALDIKRNALDSSDSILAEDIAKFPDMNVSESLQRIPGVAISRESGEGRQLTVRGLGSQFTRVRINGIEAMSTVGSQDVSTSGGGTNRGRAFDFNVFASELFNALTVHKSSSASMEEGSLGATVDLHTARPFDHPGLIISASAQAQYQSNSDSATPRVAALISNTFMGGKVGILFSGAYGVTNTLEEGTSSVRWMNNTNTSATDAVTSSYNFAKVCTDAGVTCSTSGTNFAAAGSAFKPRFPRYDIVPTKSKRLGLTSSIQWQPDEHTMFSVDALFADFSQVRNEYYLEANSFSTSGNYTADSTTKLLTGKFVNSTDSKTYYYSSTGVQNMSLINFSSANIAGTQGKSQAGNATSTLQHAEVTGVGLRNEHRQDHLDTRFMQVTVEASHEFSDKMKTHFMFGWTESHHRNPMQMTLMADLGCYGTSNVPATSCTTAAGTNSDPYIYDYTSGNMPMLSMGNVDPTSTNNWFLSQIRMREEYAYNSFRSVSGDFEYDANKQVKITGGFGIRNYGFGTLEKRRSNGVASSTGEDTTLSAALRSVPLADISSQIGLKAVSAPAGSDTNWFAIDFNKAATPLGLFDRSVNPVTAGPGYSNTGNVRENDYSAWLQAAWDTNIYGMSFRGDIGGRYVETIMDSLGYSLVTNGSTSTLTPITGHNGYHDFLPSLNAVLEPFDDFLVRFNAGYAMTRPGLTSMMPTGSVSVSGANVTASVGNPFLKPQRSKNLDLSFEWYYGKGAMISVAGFWKHLDTFIQSQQTTGTAAQNPFGLSTAAFVGACGGSGSDWSTVTNSSCTGLKENTIWTYTNTVNAKGAPLYGTEINWQQPFSFLPDPFSNFGLNANFTYVQAQQTYYGTDGKTVIMKEDLTNLSRVSYNGTLYYDDTIFQARVTAAFRSHYLINSNIASNNNNYGIYSKSSLNVDASTSYKYNEAVTFTFDAINLTNQGTNIVADKFAQRAYQFHKTGQVFFAGIKYTY
jgi:TonB-dependent receptor